MHYFKSIMFSIIFSNLINFKLPIFKSTGAVNMTLVIPMLVWEPDNWNNQKRTLEDRLYMALPCTIRMLNIIDRPNRY